MGFAFNVFLNANRISPSGFSGLSAIVSNLLAMNLNIHISASVIYLSINAILFIFAFKSLGLKFAINSAIGIISYSVFMGEVHKANIELNRKVLADLAMNHPEAFTAVVKMVKK